MRNLNENQPEEFLKEPYPRHDDDDAFVFNDLPVLLYFYSQQVPEGTEILEPVEARTAVLQKGNSCRQAGIEGLRKLQRIAVRYKANAVINIRSSWNRKVLGDDLAFGCVVQNDKIYVVWEGVLASVPKVSDQLHPSLKTLDTPLEPDTHQNSISAKIRELNNLYYQQLITKEELEERKRKLLDELQSQ